MTPAHLRTALERLGLSQTAFARLVHVQDRAVRRWIAGKPAIPYTVQVIVRLLESGKIGTEDL